MQRNTKHTVLAAAILTPILILILFVGYELKNLDTYPVGGGKHETSPNGLYEARASNMTGKIEGDLIDYYEFEVVRLANQSSMMKTVIFDDEQSVRFRQGNGRIYWDDDSRRVRFGTDDLTILHFAITEP